MDGVDDKANADTRERDSKTHEKDYERLTMKQFKEKLLQRTKRTRE